MLNDQAVKRIEYLFNKYAYDDSVVVLKRGHKDGKVRIFFFFARPVEGKLYTIINNIRFDIGTEVPDIYVKQYSETDGNVYGYLYYKHKDREFAVQIQKECFSQKKFRKQKESSTTEERG